MTTFKPDPAARRGGTLRYGVNSGPVHFDVHQSGTVANVGLQGPMYDTLIRRDPRDGQTIIPDLAQRWEVGPDGRKYTFFLRRGVKFQDGVELTAEDVEAQEARKLMAEAGYANGIKGLNFLVRGEIASFKLWSLAIQAMLEETLNIEMSLRSVQMSQWFEDANAGNFDITINGATGGDDARDGRAGCCW